MENKEIRNLQLMELKLAKEIKRVCDILNIKFFLVGGTFLGAVRHNGFIPWDDDMDVGMIREDYDRFMKEAPDYIENDFYLQNWDVDSNYPFSFAKLRLNGTTVVEKMNVGIEGHKGVFLDIFPYDNAPDSLQLRRKHARNIYILKKLMWIKKGYGKALQSESKKMWIKYNIARGVAGLFSYDIIKKIYYKELTKYNAEKTEKLFVACSYSYEKSCFLREWFEEMSEYEFEGELFPASKDYDSYLTAVYGDYLELPPEEKRHTHEIQELILHRED